MLLHPWDFPGKNTGVGPTGISWSPQSGLKGVRPPVEFDATCAVKGCGFYTLAPWGQLDPAWALRSYVAPEEWLCPQANVPGALRQVVAEGPCV